MKARAVKGIVMKDLKEVGREKMTIFWIFVFPLMWITLFGGIWGGSSPPVVVKVGAVYFNEDAPLSARDVVGIMENVTVDGTRVFRVTRYPNESAGIEALKSGRVGVLLVFPEGFGENLSRGLRGTVLAYFDRSDPQKYQITSGVVKGFFSEFERKMAYKRLNITLGYMEKYMPGNAANFSIESIKPYLVGMIDPLSFREEAVRGKKASPMQFYVTSFIGIQFLFATMLTVSGLVFEEIEKGTLRRIAASPATAWDFLTGKMISTFIVITVSILIGVGYSKLVFGETVFPGPLGWAIIVLAAVFSMSLGLAIAMGTRSMKATNAVVNLISMPLLFLAGVVIPESILPNWAKPIAEYFPLGRALKDLRLLEIYHRPPQEIAPDVVWLAAGAFGMLIVAVLLYRWAIRRLQ
ncbi:ABC transporter [Thermococcus profundus]|uniref:ABC transporter n=1 Tax=Thermococcus profundus TaxID=49899 RepID=A0A2Z2MJ25_THEPR|nr:ABC transporter permease [Thermococcus profundus]ASJ02431.1 ABC transporter [Thermococcus profundus]